MGETQEIAVPLSVNADLQLGPDGHPWLRYQINSGALTASFVLPMEHVETFINMVTDSGRKLAKKAVAKQADIIVPDFTNIAVADKNGRVESYEN